MQLILDSATTLDVNGKMATFDDTALNEKLMNSDVKPTFLNGISNCNKENVQDNIKDKPEIAETTPAIKEELVDINNSVVVDGNSKLNSEVSSDASSSEQVTECDTHETEEAKSNANNENPVTEKCIENSEVCNEIEQINDNEEFSKNEDLTDKIITGEDNMSPVIKSGETISKDDVSATSSGTENQGVSEISDIMKENQVTETDAQSKESSNNEDQISKEEEIICEKSPNLTEECSTVTNEQTATEEEQIIDIQSPKSLDLDKIINEISEEKDVELVNSFTRAEEDKVDTLEVAKDNNKVTNDDCQQKVDKVDTLEVANDKNKVTNDDCQEKVDKVDTLEVAKENNKVTNDDCQEKVDKVDTPEVAKDNNKVTNDDCQQKVEDSATILTEVNINVVPDNPNQFNNKLTNRNQDIIEIVNDTTVDTEINDIVDVDNVKDEKKVDIAPKEIQLNINDTVKNQKIYCKLSNTLDILSDDDDEPPKAEPHKTESINNFNDKNCINIEDDDDIMVVEEVSSSKDITDTQKVETIEFNEKCNDSKAVNTECKETTESEGVVITEKMIIDDSELGQSEIPPIDTETAMPKVIEEEKIEDKSLVPDDFFHTCKKSVADLTRDELEEFCIQKIVESIVDRSNLSEIKTKLKAMSQNNEEYKKKAMMLSKQIRDLQVVLKSVQEEQKKQSNTPITPLKITRSVGMQVLMTDKPGRRKPLGPAPAVANKPKSSSNQSVKPQPKTNGNQQQIPVPRLVPATPAKTNNATSQVANVPTKTSNVVPNGVKNPNPPAQRSVEKRTRVSSVTVDLTDDEPPTKISARSSPMPPVRLVPSQNLLAPRQPFPAQTIQNSPRKVYIPISGPPGPVRPGQTIMLRSVPPSGPRPRAATMNVMRMQSAMRMPRIQGPSRHPAPLPDVMKQYQPPNWKALPPAPDLKLSKVENGIVISWKIEGYQDDSYEEIASYQLYAYQETSAPPNTSLWKKIGDVKALPLPMACTLTQFMAGYKYYFAVRAVDIRSRLGPFSLPGSILLLNKM